MSKDGNVVKELIDGSLLTKKVVVAQLPYIIFLIIMAFLYIANQYHAENIARETAKIQREVKDLRAESISIASEYMYLTKRSEIERLANNKGLGLKTSKIPPMVLRADKQ